MTAPSLFSLSLPLSVQHLWGVEFFQEPTFERPTYECWHDASTGDPRHYPAWRRNVKRCVSMVVTLLQTGVLVLATLALCTPHATLRTFGARRRLLD